MSLLQFAARGLAAVVPFVFAVPAGAQTGNGADARYPTKPVRMIVPLAPGGGSDIVARILAQALTRHWGQSVVVDNRPGAGSNIGTTIAARSAPDGYSLLVTSSSFAVGPALYGTPGYDAVKDFEPITLIADQPSIIAVNPSLRARSLKELLGIMKAEPGKLTFGSAGQGTASHLANELLLTTAGVKATHVPYKSAGLVATALLGGEIQFMVTNMATAVPLVKSGKVRGLAVTSKARVASVADLPTAAEAGLPDFEYTTWYGMLAPTRTPRAILAQLHADSARVLKDPQVGERFAAQGLEVEASTSAEFASYIKAELARWSRVVRVAGLQVQ
jgi:tripartite-type tricarboxylate transporter receptor subunit TctC